MHNGDVAQFDSPEAWRTWLARNADRERAVWVAINKKAFRGPGITDVEALDEALCFGWVDTRVRRMDERRYAQLFTRRRPGSHWTDANRARFLELRRVGKVSGEGERAFQGTSAG